VGLAREDGVLAVGVGDGGVGAVAGEEERCRVQGQQVRGDAGDDLLEIGGAGGAAGAAGEEGVAGDEGAVEGETEAAGGVARGVEDTEARCSEA